jgi:hypothetical protein
MPEISGKSPKDTLYANVTSIHNPVKYNHRLLSQTEREHMFTRELTRAGQVRRFTIRESGGYGWEVREEQDSRVVRRVCYDDWHRVERALVTMREQVQELEARGWRALQ